MTSNTRRQLGISCTLVALAACGATRVNDVGDLTDGGASGSTSGGAGAGGRAGGPAGGSGPAGGRPAGGTQAVEGGAAGEATAGAGQELAGETSTGGTPPVPSCGNPRIVELFAFNDALGVVSSTGSMNNTWLKGAYDSTDTKTGKIDANGGPPSNPTNLAVKSILDVLMSDGDPAPAMRYTIPFSPSPPQFEVVNLVYIFAANGAPKDVVDVSNATLKASVKLASAPNSNCSVSINVWTTGTDPATATTYNHVDGPQAVLAADKWVNVQMNLGTSQPAIAVNQMGFALRSSCMQPQPGAGGAGGAGSEPGGPTVVLIDNITTRCK